ncbi:DsbA family protein [Kitasatospora sp. NA04385]|uniref:2-hydroxychromene-2-carboxylate isomerase n=1 Tax=Kitasatospora sp. NA04385 TaxID=2742135 RepID=UPI001164740E|nr:DsbA family protein [Kitasatospora sp. NA04385]QDJ74285.1 isomerase [Kitasatospora sp.]QKW22416.1 DsbA family protein [Kitasatospora sp. NA04385]
MARKPPRWYFSFGSAYSWMAYRDLTTRYPDVAEAIEWIPFWEPNDDHHDDLESSGVQLPYVELSREKYAYVLQDVRRLARERELRMVWPVDRAPDWEVSHLAYLVARDGGCGRQFADAAYRARWEEGRDISSPEVIARIGADLGLDPAALAGARQDPQVRARGLEALNAAYRDGVFGVPYFIDGFQRFWGVDRLPGFVSAVRHRTAAAPAAVR